MNQYQLTEVVVWFSDLWFESSSYYFGYGIYSLEYAQWFKKMDLLHERCL